ncbi:IS66 family insertion sequence element accessory protein TnpB [Agathobacter sp.]|uniref:IS66 family insertion sequence element accessory protein TnpB n=1 Tax=Agathobacter sp. TaxID=2021311 RepID=UPI003FA49196
MLNDATCFKQIYIVCGYTDLQSGIDTLVSVINSRTGNSPYVPVTLYRFCGRKADRIKGRVWEQDGFSHTIFSIPMSAY